MRNLKNKEINSISGASFSAAECEGALKLYTRANNAHIHNYSVCSPHSDVMGTCLDESVFLKAIKVASDKVHESCPSEIVAISDLVISATVFNN